jgi:hypothetical protein
MKIRLKGELEEMAWELGKPEELKIEEQRSSELVENT